MGYMGYNRINYRYITNKSHSYYIDLFAPT